MRRSWLCGYDKTSRKKYDHRKRWLEERLFHLAKYFAVEINAFAIMSNHFHLVVYYDPLACQQWDDAEVARRWTEAFPPRVSSNHPEDLVALQEAKREAMMSDPAQLEHARLTLGSISAFMKHLKQPIARRANREDKCTGHFFESRFYSGALLSDQAVLAAMAYVDLNPVRARICDDIAGYEHTSIYRRLQYLENSPERLQAILGPLESGIDSTSSSPLISLADYISHLQLLTPAFNGKMSDDQQVWFNRVASIRKRQRAYGSKDELEKWIGKRNWRRPGESLR